MAKALSRDSEAQKRTDSQAATGLDWRRRASDHIAFGLLIYTGLHIFVTMGALKSTNGSVLPYFALVVLVAAIIPGCRWVEKRWEALSNEEAADPAFAATFHREMAMLWACAIGLPLLLTVAFKAIASLF